MFDPAELLNHHLLREQYSELKYFLDQGWDPLFNTAFSKDGRFVALVLRLTPEYDDCTILVKDLENMEYTGVQLNHADEYVAFDELNHLYYVERDEFSRGYSCKRVAVQDDTPEGRIHRFAAM
jgi:hypothetical protein